MVSASLCGHEYAAEAHYAWADCAVDHAGERPDVTTSGTLDVVRSASEGDCAGPAELEESAVFEVEAALPRGRRAALSGAITASSTGRTLIRALREGERHTLVFGPGCGEGTLDGEAVELDELQGGGAPRARGRRKALPRPL